MLRMINLKWGFFEWQNNIISETDEIQKYASAYSK